MWGELQLAGRLQPVSCHMKRRRFLAAAAGAALAPGAESRPFRMIDVHVHLGRDSAEMRAVTKDNAAEMARRLVASMDAGGVEKSMIVAVEPLFPTEVYLEAAQPHKDRLMVACSVVPRPVNEAATKLKEYQKRGAKALKLQPMQYDPRDAAAERLIAQAVDLRMPVLFHHADLPKSFPDMLNHLATTFPKGQFVVVHFGGVYGFYDMLPLARLPNVWLETSTAFPRLVRSPMRGMLHFLAEEKRLDKLIFGSELASHYSEVTGAIDDLLGPDAGEPARRAVYRGNAERIMRLTVSARLLEEEQERDGYQKVSEIFKAMEVKEGSRVAEVGSGNGYFIVRLASVVGKTGRVFGVDVSESQVKRLTERLSEDGIENAEAVQGADDDPKLAAGSLDAVVVNDAYHEFVKHEVMMAKIREALKPGGRLVMVDRYQPRRRKEPREKLVKDHMMTPELAEEELRKAGFQIGGRRDEFIAQREENFQWMITARKP